MVYKQRREAISAERNTDVEVLQNATLNNLMNREERRISYENITLSNGDNENGRVFVKTYPLAHMY